jgi:hypothetical protein
MSCGESNGDDHAALPDATGHRLGTVTAPSLSSLRSVRSRSISRHEEVERRGE